MAVLTLAAWPVAVSQGAERPVRFKPGATATTVKGVIRGDVDATFVLPTVEGQVLQTRLTASNRSCYFNVSAPGQQEAVHVGSVAGDEFTLSPTKAGDYRLQVYLMRSSARRNETCRYSLAIELTGKPDGASPGVSDRAMSDRCRARVAEMYAAPPRRIRLAAIRANGDGPFVDGTVDKAAEGIKRFRCLFSPDRQLKDVMAMTPDGE